MMKPAIFLPPEWYPQSAIQLTWPHVGTDWSYMLEEVIDCYVNIAFEILKRQKLLVICRDKNLVRSELLHKDCNMQNLVIVDISSNDTWARDHGGIAVLKDKEKYIYDFTFNGWGLKFASDLDNQITRNIFTKNVFRSDVKYQNKKDFVLEGGSIEVDGKGTMLTTSACLLSPNRNSYLDKAKIEAYLKNEFGLNRILWLDYGYLKGDDTDSHIDTLARFCDENTIVYVKCEDKKDEHFDALNQMEIQLKAFKNYKGDSYQLVPLPMAEAIYDEDDNRLPATYANFLIMNTVVLMPFYNNRLIDEKAKQVLQLVFPRKEIIGVNCSSLVRQHGSLHCITMQYPEKFI